MDNVTEQDLIKLGFLKVSDTFYTQPITDKEVVIVSVNPISETIYYKSERLKMTRHLTTENLDLFIRFAKGEKL